MSPNHLEVDKERLLLSSYRDADLYRRPVSPDAHAELARKSPQPQPAPRPVTLVQGIRQDPAMHRFAYGVAAVVALYAVVQYWAAWWPYRWWIVGAVAVLALAVAVLAGCFAKLCADCWFLRPERCDSGE